MKVTLAVAFGAGCAAAATASPFAAWAKEHGKAYATAAEASHRQGVFEANLLHFAERNRWDAATCPFHSLRRHSAVGAPVACWSRGASD